MDENPAYYNPAVPQRMLRLIIQQNQCLFLLLSRTIFLTIFLVLCSWRLLSSRFLTSRFMFDMTDKWLDSQDTHCAGTTCSVVVMSNVTNLLMS